MFLVLWRQDWNPFCQAPLPPSPFSRDQKPGPPFLWSTSDPTAWSGKGCLELGGPLTHTDVALVGGTERGPQDSPKELRGRSASRTHLRVDTQLGVRVGGGGGGGFEAERGPGAPPPWGRWGPRAGHVPRFSPGEGVAGLPRLPSAEGEEAGLQLLHSPQLASGRSWDWNSVPRTGQCRPRGP